MAIVEQWIEREIARGLQGLVALRLSGAPAEDAITLTLDVWLAAVAPRARGWHEQRDAPRLREGFSVLFGSVREWPAPSQYLDCLPAPATPPALPGPPLSEAELKHNRRRVRALLDKLTQRMTPRHD